MTASSKAAPACRPRIEGAKAAAGPPPPRADDQQSSESYSSEEEDAAEEPKANAAAQPAPPPPQAAAHAPVLPPPPPPPAAVPCKHDKPKEPAAVQSNVHLVSAADAAGGAGSADAAAGASALRGDAIIDAWTERGDWRTFTPDALFKGWVHVFTEWGIDAAAQQSLFLLAQHSQRGYQEANDVIGKTIIRLSVQGPGSIGNISGWLTRCCNDARRVMHHQDYWHSIHWRNDVQYQQYSQQQQRTSSNIDRGHRQFRGYDRGAKGGGKGHRGGRRADREQRCGDGDAGQVTGGDHRTEDGTPDRRHRDHHGSDESDCGDHRDTKV